MKPALWSVLVLAAAGNAPEPGRPEAAGLHTKSIVTRLGL